MGESNNMIIQKEINQNLSVASTQGFAMTNEEMEFNAKMMANRGHRRRPALERMDRVNSGSGSNNIMAIGSPSIDKNRGPEMWAPKMNKDNMMIAHQNNRNNSENLETIRENIRNSQELAKGRNIEGLTIEEAYLKNRSDSIDSLKQRVAAETTGANEVTKRNSTELNKSPRNRDSAESLNESTADLSRSYMNISSKDPHTAGIDLSNSCRQFYFNHVKSADAIKKAVRAAKHTRAREKMEGKKCLGIDNAMDRLRSEMADLMDQDLSLMSQLLKLNDKIEEVKTQMIYRRNNDSFSQSSFSMSEVSDSELEDYDDSRINSPRTHSFTRHAHKPPIAEPEEDEETMRRISPAGSDIIIYRKTKKKGKRRARKTPSRSATDDEDSAAESDTSEKSCNSDSDSTISCNSCSSHDGDSDDEGETEDTVCEDTKSGEELVTSTKEPDTPKQVKGGVSQNRRFLSFLKKNGNTLPGKSPLLTLQGHNIPLHKYYVPQGLVYLKHSNSDNVFCQFSN